MSTSRTVTITVYDGGDFSYSRALLGVNGGDTVTWNAGQSTGAFGITFRPDTPLTAGGVSLQSGGSGNTIVGTIKSGLTIGTVYYYSVSAVYTPTNTTYADGSCPEIIVR